jgi:hypothetical protein
VVRKPGSENSWQSQKSRDAANTDHKEAEAHHFRGLLGLGYSDGSGAAGVLHEDPQCHLIASAGNWRGAHLPSNTGIWLALRQDLLSLLNST